MKTADLYASPWLRGEDLKGKSFKLRIIQATIQVFKSQNGGADEPKIVLSFQDAKKKLILNKMQHSALVALCDSDDTDDWEGMEVILSPGMTSNNKPTVVLTGIPVVANDGDGEKKMAF